MRDLLQSTGIWSRISSSSELLSQPPEEQIEQSWAKPIKSYDEVPEFFKRFFTHNGSREFPYAVLTPSFSGFIHTTTEKLICDYEHEIYVLERRGNDFDVNCYPLEEINCVEVRTILLDSSIIISGVTKDGVPASSAFRFNSTTDFLFIPILHRMRHAPTVSSTSAHNMELDKFDSWKCVNFKFMNYARRSLLVGEKVIHSILQPEIRDVVLKVLGKTYDRVIYPTLASILTDRELIMIREEKVQRGDGKYGGIWQFIPLKKIRALSLGVVDKNLLILSVKLPDRAPLEYLFRSSTEREINRLQNLFNELTFA